MSTSQTQTYHLLFLKVKVTAFGPEFEIKSWLCRAFLERLEAPWSAAEENKLRTVLSLGIHSRLISDLLEDHCLCLAVFLLKLPLM